MPIPVALAIGMGLRVGAHVVKRHLTKKAMKAGAKRTSKYALGAPAAALELKGSTTPYVKPKRKPRPKHKIAPRMRQNQRKRK